MYYLKVTDGRGYFGGWQAVLLRLGAAPCLAMWLCAYPSISAPTPAPPPDPGSSAGPILSGKTKVWIHFRDKGSPPLSSLRAEEAKPIFRPYLEGIARSGAEIEVGLKWQNAVSAWVDAKVRDKLGVLDYVISVTEFPKKAPVDLFAPDLSPLAKRGSVQNDFGQFSTVFGHVGIDSAHALLASEGALPGSGLTVAIIDSDFFLGHTAFSELKTSGRIKDQWDFVAKTSQGVEESRLGYSHGGSVLSLLAGYQPGVTQGAVRYADYLLYRAEDVASETYVEEDYVAAAIERAVDSGAQIINISLGYRYEFDNSPDHPYASMDGRTRPASLAALGAARRNVLVVAAMGNLPAQAVVGPSLVSPADADSILSVGIVDAALQHCLYSCTGPAADGRIKPEVVSVGPLAGCRVPTSDTRTAGEVEAQGGTSFAAPVIAALAALTWQAGGAPEADKVRRAIMMAGHNASAPNGTIGYGIPDAMKAILLLRSGHEVIGEKPESRANRARLFRYPGGKSPIRLAMLSPGTVPGGVALLDARGASHPVKVGIRDGLWEILPQQELSRGFYWLRVRSEADKP